MNYKFCLLQDPSELFIPYEPWGIVPLLIDLYKYEGGIDWFEYSPGTITFSKAGMKRMLEVDLKVRDPEKVWTGRVYQAPLLSQEEVLEYKAEIKNMIDLINVVIGHSDTIYVHPERTPKYNLPKFSIFGTLGEERSITVPCRWHSQRWTRDWLALIWPGKFKYPVSLDLFYELRAIFHILPEHIELLNAYEEVGRIYLSDRGVDYISEVTKGDKTFCFDKSTVLSILSPEKIESELNSRIRLLGELQELVNDMPEEGHVIVRQGTHLETVGYSIEVLPSNPFDVPPGMIKNVGDEIRKHKRIISGCLGKSQY